MSEKPILYSTEMAKAILEGRKTQTRRLRGLEEINKNPNKWCFDSITIDENRLISWFENKITDEQIGIICPYEVGMTLWVRETWCGDKMVNGITEFVYKAGFVKHVVAGLNWMPKWKPSIHMPHVACRLRLKVTNIRVERLQEITEEDAIREGVQTVPERDGLQINGYDGSGHRTAFALLWDGLNNKRGYGWLSNPWVWVIEFKEVAL